MLEIGPNHNKSKKIMLPWGPPDIKFSIEMPKSHIGKHWNFAKLTHGPLYFVPPCIGFLNLICAGQGGAFRERPGSSHCQGSEVCWGRDGDDAWRTEVCCRSVGGLHRKHQQQQFRIKVRLRNTHRRRRRKGAVYASKEETEYFLDMQSHKR